ncbi:hypothetical protein I5776_19460 [Heyndrickxia vini]|uniref:Uncharacterized protein n=1 Tax=Heyndrickxia vini TaxID=1476025 RepID=A0ABX7E066_9BACI|nr:hypothetical protein I5776_19460 [Heyndrickxia vini]
MNWDEEKGLKEKIPRFFPFFIRLFLRINNVRSFPLQVLAFRGAGDEPPRRFASCGVSSVQLIPQESRTFRSNPLCALNTVKKTFF